MITETVTTRKFTNKPDLKMTTFGMKTRTRIGTWNVRTLSETSRLAQVCKEFNTYRLTLLGLCETRWYDSGEFTTSDGLTLLYSGKTSNEPRSSGVGILLSKPAKKSLIDWKPYSDRIITARLRTRARNLTCIQCYAPTEAAELSTKESFYDLLGNVLKTVPRGDIVIMMGDFNAQVGPDNTNVESTMGKHGLGRLTENGEMLLDTCTTNNLVIGGTLFPHPRVHKVTWVSPDGITENQIDHITISRKWRGSLLDVRNKRGADIASDHHLVLATIRIKIAAIRKNNEVSRRRFNVNKLDEPTVANSFTDALKTSLQSNNNNIDRSWEETKQIFIQAADNHLGYKNNLRKEWISDETWKLILDRKEAKALINSSRTRSNKTIYQRMHNSLNREVKRSARRDKRNWVNNIAKEAQAAAETYRIGDLYRAAKKLTNTAKSTCKPLKNNDGELVTSKQEQLKLWEEFYGRMLSTSPPMQQTICSCESHLTNTNISTDCPNVTEICNAIKLLKNNKSPGIDNISPELLKIDVDTSAQLLAPIINQFWCSEQLPEEIAEGVIVNLPKKGDLTDRKNWRGITLLSMVNKVIAQIINVRLSTALLPALRKEQAGFRAHKSCVDHVNSLRVIVEQSVEWRSPLYLTFIDFEKAFDTLNHASIWNALECKGVPTKLIALIKGLYENATCRILHENQLSNKINICSGVRQGCVLSPLLFNCVLDVIMHRATRHRSGITWGLQGRLEDLDYADDICLLTHTFSDMQSKLSLVQEIASYAGLKINIGKTKVMRINVNNEQILYVNGQALAEVESFCYLGSILDKSGGSKADISSRINKARQAFGQLKRVWNSSYLSIQTKLRIFNSNVKSTLLYGCETWNAATRDMQSVQVFVNKCLRKILQIYWPRTITNNQLWLETQQQPIQIEIRKRKWSWIGHTLRKQITDIARQAIDWNPQGSRRRGRPSHTWKRQIESEISHLHLSWNEVKRLALDRAHWNDLVAALCSLQE